MALLSIGNDAKTVKGEARGYMTGVQYLAPANLLRGHNLCPDASPECKADCLFTAGRGAYDSVREARLARTRRFFADRATYLADLRIEIRALMRKAARAGMTPLVRLNGTSDVAWESVRTGGLSVFEQVPEVQFYDYTKSHKRMLAFLRGAMPQNYHLTFSRSECNDAAALDVLSKGGNVAVVFSTRKGEALPTKWYGYTVIDGDASDVRHADAVPGSYNAANGAASIGVNGVVIGLRAKGRARRRVGGFVVKAAA
jgi:hypothetical protein